MTLTATIHRHQERPKIQAEGTGCSPGTWLHVVVPGEVVERPPRPAWISDVPAPAETIDVWTEVTNDRSARWRLSTSW